MKKKKSKPQSTTGQRSAAQRSAAQTISQKRNWVKRMILCYTAGYRTVLNHYRDSLTHRELANVEAMVVTGTILIENWTKKKEE